MPTNSRWDLIQRLKGQYNLTSREWARYCSKHVHVEDCNKCIKICALGWSLYYSCNQNIDKFQGSHYRNASTDPLGTGCGSLGIHRARFGNHCSKANSRWPSQKNCSHFMEPDISLRHSQSLLLVSVMSHMKSFHTLASYLFIHLYHSPVQAMIFQVVRFIRTIRLTVRLVYSIHAACPSHLSLIIW